jgi:hypothetical protein
MNAEITKICQKMNANTAKMSVFATKVGLELEHTHALNVFDRLSGQDAVDFMKLRKANAMLLGKIDKIIADI